MRPGERRKAGAAHNPLAGRRPVSRRRFLELLAGAGTTVLVVPTLPGVVLGADAPTAAPPLPPGYVPTFPDGVIAGDPRPDGSVIWTRLGAAQGGASVPILWEVALDAAFTTIAAGGTITTEGADDWTAKVLVDGLEPDLWYHYRFVAGSSASPVGRLRTAPRSATTPDRLRFAFASCQQRGESLYVAHDAIAAEPELDFFMHLGDYIYVNDSATLGLGDYRTRYHDFKANPKLQACQQQVPLVAMLDDGEIYNGADAAGPPGRLAAARQAWIETMPVWAPTNDPFQFYRQFAWGDLADIFMIDVRSYRDPAVDATDTRTPEGAVMLEAGRTTLGAPQKQWLREGLRASRAWWRFIGNPYNLALWRAEDHDPGPPRPPGVEPGEGVYIPNEAWDDYSAERRELLQFIADNEIPNVVSCSAHTHVWIASHLSPDPDDPGSPLVAYDFTSGSLTADPDLVRGTPDPVAFLNVLAGLGYQSTLVNPQQTYLNLVNHGYAVVEVTPCATTVEFKVLDTFDPAAVPVTLARFRVHNGASTMETEIGPTRGFSCPDPSTVVAWPGSSTGLSPVADVCTPPFPPGPTESTTTTTTSTTAPPVDPGSPVAGDAAEVRAASVEARAADAQRIAPRFTG